MQGQRSAKGSLPESLGFDNGSSSSDAGIDQPIFWNNMRNTTQNRVSGYVSPSNTSEMYLNSASQEGQSLIVWSVGEPSSSSVQNQVSGEQKMEYGWSSSMKPFTGADSNSEAQQFEAASMLSLDEVNVNLSHNQVANGPLLLQSSSSDSIAQDFNVSSSFVAQSVVDCGVMERPNICKPGSSENLRVSTASGSLNPFPSTGGGYLEESDGRPVEGRRLSCKRKALEMNAGQSSESGSSSFFHRPEGSVWHAVPARLNTSSSLNISNPPEATLGAIPSEQVMPRLGLGVGGVASENPLVLPPENTHRNVRLRINAPHQQDLITSNNVLTPGNSVARPSLSSPYSSSRLFTLNNPVDLRAPAAVSSSSPQGQPALRVPALRRTLQSSRWTRSSSSRPGRSPNFLVSGERATASHEDPNLRSVPRNISEHPIFVPTTEIRNSDLNSIGWSLTGGNASSVGNVASTSRTSSGSGVHSLSSPNWDPHRNSPQYSRRLSEIVRRSLLASTDSEAGGQTNNVSSSPSGTSASTQEVALPPGVGNLGHRLSHSRSAVLLDRHLDGALGIPYSMRTLAAASEGRSRLVSEIRNVLDLMRRGEGLRFEDVMILDQSVFYGVADIHDRHRDMRLDIDNMSYEELLALEERIGNVNTGLSEETILHHLKLRKYVTTPTSQPTEPCCICQEEYKDGEDLGALGCGHDFHTCCIKQWLVQKNSCPICKSAALPT